MSIVGCVKVNDGVIMGADSATMVSAQIAPGEVQVVKSYQNAQKVFRIGDLKAAILIYGIGNIGTRSLSSIIYEFNKKLILDNNRTNKTIKEISDDLFLFLKQKYDSAFSGVPDENKSQLQLGIYVAGYSDDDVMASEWEFILPFDSEVKRVRDIQDMGISWRGMSVPFTRIYKGFDPRLMEEIVKKFSLDPQELMKIISTYQIPIAFNGMPLKDAIDFLRYMLLTTINNYRFEFGIQSCSEPIDIVVITQKEYQEITMKKPNF